MRKQYKVSFDLLRAENIGISDRSFMQELFGQNLVFTHREPMIRGQGQHVRLSPGNFKHNASVSIINDGRNALRTTSPESHERYREAASVDRRSPDHPPCARAPPARKSPLAIATISPALLYGQRAQGVLRKPT